MLEYESGHVLVESPPCVSVCKVGAVARGVNRLIEVELDLDTR
jgi:Fe-S-cluster-containing dehydrogenase component